PAPPTPSEHRFPAARRAGDASLSRPPWDDRACRRRTASSWVFSLSLCPMLARRRWQNRPGFREMLIAKQQEQHFAGYTILHIIGQGGQAQVYLAERDQDGLRVAIKVLDRTLRQDRVFLERFVREYKLIAKLDNEFV